MTDDLVAFLWARLAEDEAAARLCPPWPWRLNAEHDTVLAADGVEVTEAFALSNNQLRHTAAHIVRHDPARVLREVESKCAVLIGIEAAEAAMDQAMRDNDQTGYRRAKVECDVLRRHARRLAAVYADHPDCREEWRP